jgi:hypothetical protein
VRPVKDLNIDSGRFRTHFPTRLGLDLAKMHLNDNNCARNLANQFKKIAASAVLHYLG